MMAEMKKSDIPKATQAAAWATSTREGRAALAFLAAKRTAASMRSSAASAAAGTDDFAGLRRFEPGQSPRQIAWKAVARGAPLLSKRFLDEARRAPWHLDWDDTAALRDVEQRLSRLTAWVLRADADGRDFSLHLPNAALAQGTGVAQREQALRLLATFGHDEEGAP